MTGYYLVNWGLVCDSKFIKITILKLVKWVWWCSHKRCDGEVQCNSEHNSPSMLWHIMCVQQAMWWEFSSSLASTQLEQHHHHVHHSYHHHTTTPSDGQGFQKPHRYTGKGTTGKGQSTDFKNPYPHHGSGVTLDICCRFFISYKFIIIITIIITIIIYWVDLPADVAITVENMWAKVCD